MKKYELAEALLWHGEDLDVIFKSIPEFRDEAVSIAIGKAKELSEEIIQTVRELIAKGELELSAEVRQLHGKLSQFEHELVDSTKRHREFIESEVVGISRRFAEDAARSIRRDLDKILLEVSAGVVSEETVVKAGKLYTYRGGTYLAKKDMRGILPNRTVLDEPNSPWVVFASPGMSRGSPYSPTPMVAIGSAAQIVPAPATKTSAGAAGNIAYDNFYFYVCIAANTWRRTAMGAW